MSTSHDDIWQKHLDELEQFNDPANFAADGSFFIPSKDGVTENYFPMTFPEAAAVGQAEEGELPLDVLEDETNLYVITPLAGATPADLTVSVENDVLAIKGKRSSGMESAGKNHIYRDCFWGNFTRSIVLPKPVDAATVRATLRHGVLTIVLPKKPLTDALNISINEEDEYADLN